MEKKLPQQAGLPVSDYKTHFYSVVDSCQCQQGIGVVYRNPGKVRWVTAHHDMTKILLKVALNNLNQTSLTKKQFIAQS